jgi:hypothetical protein
MAATCFNHLNYIAIFLLYILSFYFIYNTYAQIIGFSVLFVVNTAFIFFLLSQYTSFKLDSNLHLPYERQIAAFSIMIGLGFHFIAFILIIVMASKLKITVSDTNGTPLGLTGIYKTQMDNFKENLLIVFSFILFLLLWLMYGTVPSLPFMQYGWFQKTFSTITIIISIFTIGFSIRQVILSNEFSKLQNRQI